MHRTGRVHNNADSMSSRPCHNNQCKYCDRYERKYSPELLADLDKTAGKKSAVQKLAVGEGNIVDETGVILPCFGSDHHAVVCPNDGDDHDVTLPNDGTEVKHVESVLKAEQDGDPEFSGPSIIDENVLGRTDHSTMSLEPGLTEVLSPEMSRSLSQEGVHHSMHAMPHSVWNGVGTHEIIDGCHSCCCCLRTTCYREDWMDHVEDMSLFGCLFETGVNLDKMNDAHAGVTQTVEMCKDQPWGLYEKRLSTDSPNNDNFQADHLKCSHSTCKLCFKVSQLYDGSGQSTSSCEETGVCIDITQDNIRLKQREDTILKHLIEWKRDGENPLWSTVAPYCRDLKAYWHEWDTIELRDDVLSKKRFRDVGNVAEYLFLMPAVLRKEVFR